jgi:hypothetical protein
MTQLKVVAKETGQELTIAKKDAESNPFNEKKGYAVLGFIGGAAAGLGTFVLGDKLTSDAVAAQIKADTQAAKTPQQISKGTTDLLTTSGIVKIGAGLGIGGLAAYFLDEGIAQALALGAAGGLFIGGGNDLWTASKVAEAAKNGITVAVVA